MILKTFIVGAYGTNSYLLGSEKDGSGILIDPGADAETILEVSRELGLQIKLIVITHGHSDHTGAVPAIKEATGAPVAVHPGDKSYYGRVFGQPDRLLGDGDSIDVSEMHLKVMHTPGHSPGGICLYGRRVLFCGDTLFNGSIGRTDIAGGSLKQLMDSITHKLLALPDETVIYPGHGPKSTIGEERRRNPFLRQHI